MIFKNLSDLSGGEIIKLLLSKMLLGKYNILLMDEPGNYLDLKSIAALETMMKSYAELLSSYLMTAIGR